MHVKWFYFEVCTCARKMDTYIDLCHAFGMPLWMSPLIHAAARRKTDREKRRKLYRLIQRVLVARGVGCESRDKPTYVYPAELKAMVRTAFPQDLCDYQDPCHQNVIILSVDDLIWRESS